MTLRVLSVLFLPITYNVTLPILNSDVGTLSIVVKIFGVKPFPPGEAGIPV